jgi:hypothetical protein
MLQKIIPKKKKKNNNNTGLGVQVTITPGGSQVIGSFIVRESSVDGSHMKNGHNCQSLWQRPVYG